MINLDEKYIKVWWKEYWGSYKQYETTYEGYLIQFVSTETFMNGKNTFAIILVNRNNFKKVHYESIFYERPKEI